MEDRYPHTHPQLQTHENIQSLGLMKCRGQKHLFSKAIMGKYCTCLLPRATEPSLEGLHEVLQQDAVGWFPT